MFRIVNIILCVTHLISAYNNGVAQTPAMGWNTWCSVQKCGTDVCNQWEVLSVAQAMKSNGMYDAGYTHINMDDCWDACERSSSGQIQPDPKRFPDGIKALADNLHNLGFKFGLYTSAGSTTCSSGQRTCPGGNKPPGSFGHYKDDTQTFADWGVDYVKIDWCGKNLTNSTAQQSEFSADLNATGRHIWLELCRGYPKGDQNPPYVAQVANSWRIAGDHHDSWSSTQQAIASSINATSMSGAFNWAYNDFLMTGGEGCVGDKYSNPNVTHPHCPGQLKHEYRTEYTMWTIIQSPLLVATDVRNMTDIMNTLLLNKEVIAVNQNTDYAAGNIVPSLTKNCDKSTPNACHVWSKQLSEKCAAMVLYNSGNEDHNVTVKFESIPNMGWSSSTSLDIRDLWANQDIGSFTGSFNAKVKYHGVVLITGTSS